MTLIAKNAKTYHMNEAPVALRLDWVPGMAADLLNWCAETTKRYERDIQVNYSDFTHEHLVVAHPGPGSGSAAPVKAPAAAPTPPAAAPKTLPKLKFSLKKPAPQ
jgi:transcription initiation factor TFIID subunit 1